MLRTLITEFLLPLLLFLLVRNMFRGFMSSSAPTRQRSGDSSVPVSPGGELKKDPVCGTYVSTAASVSKKVGGEIVYFCSTECRDKFRG